MEAFALADRAGAVAAGVGFAVLIALFGAGAGGLAAHPNNISRVTWTASRAFTEPPK